MTTKNKTTIEMRSESLPFIEHEDYEKCGQCLKEMISHQVAKEMVLSGRFDDSCIGDYFREVDVRFKETYLFKEMTKLKSEGKTISEAVKIMEGRGYIP